MNTYSFYPFNVFFGGLFQKDFIRVLIAYFIGAYIGYYIRLKSITTLLVSLFSFVFLTILYVLFNAHVIPSS
jgi:hypothetical protein